MSFVHKFDSNLGRTKVVTTGQVFVGERSPDHKYVTCLEEPSERSYNDSRMEVFDPVCQLR